MADMKRCKKCGVEKPLTDFHPNGLGSYAAKCKPCNNEASRAYRLAHIERYRAYDRKRNAVDRRTKPRVLKQNTNRYEHSSDGGHLRIVTKRGHVFLIDHEDEALARKHCWSLDGRYAVAGTTRGYKAQKLKLHRLILNAPPGQWVDHVNGDGRDNRRANIRFCTPQQNAANRVGYSKRFKFKGVNVNQTGVIQAQIKVGGKLIILGSAPTLEDAARMYDDAAKQHFGEFARLNFPR